ncbi:MAG: hypothetical protein Ct9H300mP19_12390 [Dehalococcoidia bacterium]|nr:MAG: hypothetical protein Ct9H300mP19_12390 [Dehalococcoidia bacterium]
MGCEDRVFPLEHGYRLAQLLPNVSMHIIENARHVPFLDHPDAVKIYYRVLKRPLGAQ